METATRVVKFVLTESEHRRLRLAAALADLPWSEFAKRATLLSVLSSEASNAGAQPTHDRSK